MGKFEGQVTTKKVLEFCGRLGYNKAPGPGGIPNKDLKVTFTFLIEHQRTKVSTLDCKTAQSGGDERETNDLRHTTNMGT